MADRSKLIPTPTVDKNGKQTTVYRKQELASTPASLPRVSVPQETTSDTVWRETAIEDLLDHMAPLGYNDGKRHDLKESLHTYSDELLGMLIGDGSGLDKDDPDSSLPASIVSGELMNGKPENMIREGLYFYPLVKSTGVTHLAARNMVKSLHEYPQLPQSEDLSRESDEVKAKCVALLKVLKAAFYSAGDEIFHDDDNFWFVMKDKRLAEFTINNHDKADLIAGAIMDRGAADVEMLAELIDSESPALGSGIL